MTSWKSLWAFLLLIPLCGILVWYILNRKKKRAAIQYSSIGNLKKVSSSLKVKLSGLPLLLRSLAVILAITALARPQKSDTKIKRNVEGIDIIVALDTSDSMLIEDMKPANRLESSKKIIKEFIEERISDRIGLLVFSGESYTRVPLTLDYPLLQDSLSKVTTSRNIKMGTAIGVALANAVGRLKESTAKTRVVIFLTDGENNSGSIDPETALEIAKGYGVRIYSIGMGKDGQAKLPYFVNVRGKKRVKRYRPIHSKINEKLLNKMAEETHGKYFRATTTEALSNVFKEINRLEKTKIEVNELTQYKELFPPYLVAAVILYLLSFILGATYLRRNP